MATSRNIVRTVNPDTTVTYAIEFDGYDATKADDTMLSAAKWFQENDTDGLGFRDSDDELIDPEALTNNQLKTILANVIFRHIVKHGRAYRKVVGEAAAASTIQAETDKVLGENE